MNPSSDRPNPPVCMAIKLVTRSGSGGTTDQSTCIADMRTRAEEGGLPSSFPLAAADLLEVHDASGLSLEKFGYVMAFVNAMLEHFGHKPLIPNGI
jgi:hypothetical protein